MVDVFSRSWLCDLFVYSPLYADGRKAFVDDGDFSLLGTGAAFVVANSSKLLANQKCWWLVAEVRHISHDFLG